MMQNILTIRTYKASRYYSSCVFLPNIMFSTDSSNNSSSDVFFNENNYKSCKCEKRIEVRRGSSNSSGSSGGSGS